MFPEFFTTDSRIGEALLLIGSVDAFCVISWLYSILDKDSAVVSNFMSAVIEAIPGLFLISIPTLTSFYPGSAFTLLISNAGDPPLILE